MEQYEKRIANHRYSGVIIILLIGSILLRPTLFGENYNTVGIIVILIALILYVVRLKTFYFRGNSLKIVISITIFWLYCMLQSMILQDSTATLQLTLNNFITSIIATLTYGVLLNNPKIGYNFFKVFLILLSILSLSYTVTILISLFRGFQGQYLFQIQYNGYPTSGHVYFPFSITYGEYTVTGIWLERFLSIFRESGITQIFYCWGFFMAKQYFKKYNLIRVLMALGIIFCFSLSGYIAFGISLILSFEFRKKENRKFIIGATVLLAIVIYCLTSVQGIRIQDKYQGSIDDRIMPVTRSINILKEHPLFGTGYSNNIGSWYMNINFLGIASKIGIVGCILYFLPYIFSFLAAKDKKLYTSSMASLIITLLTSQPLVGACLIYALFFADYDIKNKF